MVFLSSSPSLAHTHTLSFFFPDCDCYESIKRRKKFLFVRSDTVGRISDTDTDIDADNDASNDQNYNLTLLDSDLITESSLSLSDLFP